MSEMATGSQVQTKYITETTFGVLPATPTMKVLPVTSNTLKLTRGSLVDNTLRGDRMGGDVRMGMHRVDGDLAFNYRYGDFDELLANIFMGEWSAVDDTLKAGSTITSQAIETAYTDIEQFVHYLGLRGASLNISVKPDALIPMTMTFMGVEQSSMTSSSVASATTDFSYEPFDSFTGSILENGSEIAIVTGIDLTITNNLAESVVVFSDKRDGFVSGNLVVEGTLTAQFIDTTLFNKFKNETGSSLSFTLTDPSSNSHTWSVPNLVYTDADITVPDENELAMSLPFHAQYDATSETKIKITRS